MSLGFFVSQPSAFSLDLDSSFKYVSRLNKKDWDKKQNPLELHWRLKSGARYFNRDTDESSIFQTNLKFVSQYNLASYLRFYGAFNLVFQTGRSQSRYGDLSPQSGVYVDDAYAFLSPFGKSENLTLEIGALNQDRTVGNGLLVKGSAFPGISEKFVMALDDYSLVFRAQQLIPYSQTQNAELREKEDTPYLFTESLSFKIKQERFNVKLGGGFYSYSKLPSQVAEQSRLIGNSVTGNDLNAQFDYDFKGWFANADFDLLLGKYLVLFRSDFVENLEADEKYNRGHSFEVAVRYTDKNIEFGPSVRMFSLEPDVAPAYYNSSFFGNTNREGFQIELQFYKKKASIPWAVTFAYVDAKLLNKNLNVYQEDQKLFLLTLKTNFQKVGI